MEETETKAPDELLMEQLENRDWEQLWLRLLARCYWLLKNRYTVRWDKDKSREFSQEAVSGVISKIFVEKTRNWNINEYPEFEDFVVGVIDSYVNNSLNKKQKEHAVGDDHSYFDNGKIEPNAENVVMTEELRAEIHSDLEASGADDDELLIFECLVDQIEKPEDIRNELGMSESDFHNAWRRLKRRRKVIHEKLAAYGY